MGDGGLRISTRELGVWRVMLDFQPSAGSFSISRPTSSGTEHVIYASETSAELKHGGALINCSANGLAFRSKGVSIGITSKVAVSTPSGTRYLNYVDGLYNGLTSS